MKTSNKLLIGAFIIIVIAMIISNVIFKNKIYELNNTQGVELKEKTDTVSADTTSTHVNIHIN